MDRTHAKQLADICMDDIDWMDNLTYVYEAIAVAERERWPLLGLSVTRRSLNLLATRYNDEKTQCLTCFICAQQRTTCSGYPVVDLTNDQANLSLPFHTEIGYHTQADFCKVETKASRYSPEQLQLRVVEAAILRSWPGEFKEQHLP